MQVDKMSKADLFKELSDQEQEVIAGGETWSTQKLQSFLNGVFAEIGKYGGFYNGFDYTGFFNSLQKNGYLDSSSPGGSKSTVPGSANWRG